jgi:hypothetical protein
VNFAMLTVFSTDFCGNGKLSTLIYFQKNQWITVKVTFVAKGQLSVLITPGRQATGNFQFSVQPIQRAKSTEVTF